MMKVSFTLSAYRGGPCAGDMRHPFKESLSDTDADAFQTPFFEQTFQVASTAQDVDKNGSVGPALPTTPGPAEQNSVFSFPSW
jgi:hypothetical protein